jgi:hypothetical protein
MPTEKQQAASRANAQKSTGPRTSAGKAISRFNALKHGIFAVHQIMFDEKPEDLAELSAEYHEHHSPADADECLLVDTLVHTEWRLRRMRRVEAGLWYRAYNKFVVKNIEVTLRCTSGDAFVTDSCTFERLQRVVNSCERDYHRALKDLERLQVARAHGLRSPQPEQSKPTSASSGSFRHNPQHPRFVAPNRPPPDRSPAGGPRFPLNPGPNPPEVDFQALLLAAKLSAKSTP